MQISKPPTWNFSSICKGLVGYMENSIYGLTYGLRRLQIGAVRQLQWMSPLSNVSKICKMISEIHGKVHMALRKLGFIMDSYKSEFPDRL
jgi:hypothetical protein